MRYTAAVLSVKDIGVSRQFYEELFGLEVFQDYGANILFGCGLSLQQRFHWLVGLPEEQVGTMSNNMELAFEEADFDGFLERLRERPEIRRLGEVVEHGWGQRVVRFYDPDGHLIEVGEEMRGVVRRFLEAGLTLDEVSRRMDVSLPDLQRLLG